MPRPLLLAVSPDRALRERIARDLETTFDGEYEARALDSSEAWEAIPHLASNTLALVIADEETAPEDGLQLLVHVHQVAPLARRVLLTAYRDVDAAVEGFDRDALDYYLLKPWDPEEGSTYTVLRDLLADWRAATRLQDPELLLVGYQWSPQSHALRRFLASNQVPYRWLNYENDQQARRLLEQVGAEAPRLPVVIFPDKTYLQQPSPAGIGERIGLHIHPSAPHAQVLIVGAGPAGLAAAVYAASEGLETVVVEREAPGGQAGSSSRIENYLGFPAGLSGADLARRGVAQAERFGVDILTPIEAVNLRVDGQYRCVTFSDGSEMSADALLIATGVSYRRLEVPGMDHLEGAGIYYGSAMWEAPACRGADVYVVGGANSAGQAAIYLAQYARHVTMLVLEASLDEHMSRYLVEEIQAVATISVRPNTAVRAVEGEDHLERVVVEDLRTGARAAVPAQEMFIFIGAEPHTDWVAGVLERDDAGYILTGRDLLRDGRPPPDWPLDRDPYLLEASVPGVFAAGDVRAGTVKRVAAAVGQGSTAVMLIHQYLD